MDCAALAEYYVKEVDCMKRPVLLIVDDEPQVRETLRLLLDDDFETVSAADAGEALEAVDDGTVDMVLLDLNLPGVDGLETLDRIKSRAPETEVVMLSATDSAQQAVASLRKGAYDYESEGRGFESLRAHQ